MSLWAAPPQFFKLTDHHHTVWPTLQLALCSHAAADIITSSKHIQASCSTAPGHGVPTARAGRLPIVGYMVPLRCLRPKNMDVTYIFWGGQADESSLFQEKLTAQECVVKRGCRRVGRGHTNHEHSPLTGRSIYQATFSVQSWHRQ